MYLDAHAEAIPLVAATVDVVVCRNSLDHVEDPDAAAAEMRRILRPGGSLILNVDLDHPATEAEPHTLTEGDLERLLDGFSVRKRSTRRASGREGRATVVVAERD